LADLTRRRTNTKNLVISALLTAIGILIPIVMQPPFKILIEPASFTLASHVPVLISMFVSPLSAVIVSIGTALGFLIAGMPIVIVLRALSHIIFAVIGALLIYKGIVDTKKVSHLTLFCLLIAVIHAASEVLVVLPFYFGGGLTAGFYDKGFLTGIIGLVGVGTMIHSSIDFIIAIFVVKVLERAHVFNVKH